MSKADAKRSKPLRRAREDLTRGLRRHDLALVLGGYLGIPDDEATSSELGEARRWLALELRKALAAREGPALEPWLATGARLPALLGRLGLDDEARWALFWAAAGAQHWKPAELLLRELEPLLRERAADLARAMAIYVTSRGQLAPEQIPELLREPPPDERLGVEVVRPRHRRARSASPPANAAEAERELIDCHATEPFDNFSALALRWLRAKPEQPVAAVVGVTVAELASLDLLRGIETGDGRASFAVVELVLAAVSAVVPHSSGERERGERALLLSLRVVLGALIQPGRARPPAGLVAAAVRAALAAPSLRDSVALAITEIAGREGAELSAQLLCELHGLSPTPLLWARAALALDAEEERRFRHGRRPRQTSADWIERTLAAHLSDPGAVQRSIAALAAKRRSELFSVLAATIEPRRVADVFIAFWPAADAAQRRELANFAHDALETNTSVTFCSECDEPHVSPLDDFSDLSAQGQALYDRVAPLLLSRDERFLSLELDRTQKRSERRDLLIAFAHDAAPIDQHLAAIERARSFGLPQKPFRERLRALFGGRLAPLARGLDLAVDRLGVRSSTARELAEALLDAARGAPVAQRSELVHRQLRLAQRITGRSRRGQDRQIALPFMEASS